MSKQEDNNFLKIQTCVLKVNIHCDGCKQKVKKLLQKIDGVYTTSIDAEQGKVTVSGNVDPATLVKKLAKSGKLAELLTPKINSSSSTNNNNNDNNNAQKPQLQNGKGQQKDIGKPQKGGGGGGNGGNGGGGKDQKGQLPPQLPPQLQQQQLQQIAQMKGLKLPQFKDLNLNPFHKDTKSVKFAPLPDDEGSDYDDDDEDDYDDDDLDDIDGFDADFEDDFKTLKIKPANGNLMKASGGGGGGGGGGVGNAKKVEIPVHNKGMNVKIDAKNGNGKGGNAGAAAPKNNGGGGGKPQDCKSAGGNNNKNAPNGNVGGNNNNKNGGGNGGNGKHDLGMGNPMNAPNLNPNMMMGQGFRGMDIGQQMAPPPTGNMQAAVQGLPAGIVPPPGYFQNRMAAAHPEMMGAANPYQQQQYMAAMMQQQQLQQQQRMMIMNGQDQMYQPMMGYPRPPMYMAPPPHGEPYTHFFSDENTSSCNIM